MVSSNLRGAAFAVALSFCLARNISAQVDSTNQVKSAVARIAAVSVTAPFPMGEDSPFSASITIMPYETMSSESDFMPLIGMQWWVSPNLALMNTSGLDKHQNNYVRLQRVGLRYLPASMAIREARPEVLLVQGTIKGLPEYTARWNEFQWRYALAGDKWGATVGLFHLSQIIIPTPEWSAGHVSDRLEGSTNGILAAGRYVVMEWLQLNLRLVATSDLVSITFQMDAIL